ncbi:MAG: hypothetical protein E7566_07920 [Ruminococcaceae bacterium]|nr:hypothetical protein [Oscillospiraceae bacterium]
MSFWYILIIGVVVFFIVFICMLLQQKSERKRVEGFREATEELRGICTNYYGDEVHLNKQDPRISKLIQIYAYNPHIYTQTPKKIVYTGATVGGVSTGGFHTTGGQIIRTDLSSDRFEICFWKKEWNSSTQTDEWVAKPIKKFILSDELKEIARKDTFVSDYLDKKGDLIVTEDFKVSAEAALLFRGGYTGHAVNTFNMDKVDSYPDEFKCKWILDFVYGTNYNNE